MLSSHCYAIDTLLALQSVMKYADNEFYFVGGYYRDTCTAGDLGVITRIHPVIGRMDSLGNISTIRHYVMNAGCSNGPGDLEITGSKSVITWGRDAMFFALKADSLGEPVWAKHFNSHGGFRFIKELPGGDLLAGINMDTAGAVIARLNPDGDFIWCKSYIRPTGMVHDCMIESDESFVITGFTDSLASTDIFAPLPTDYQPKLFMMKLDGAGEVQWCKGYANEYTWYSRAGSQIVKAQDGNYVVLANLGFQTFNRWNKPFLMKTDESGDTLWTRSNGRMNYTYETKHLLAHSDGSFLYNGRIWGDLPEGQSNFAFLYKSDSQGHLPCFELSHPVEVFDLFPTDSSFALTSVDGASARLAFVTDAFFNPITTYDGCTFTTGFSPSVRKGQSMRVRPNPNTGHFTVEFQDPLMADSYYSVYDAMGKLLLQRAAAHGKKTEEVDLSRYGAGTYVIKFTDQDGVCYEQVVVE